MAMYEGDGGVSYGEKVFAESRKRKEEEAKKAEKFAKNLQKINLGIAGANWLINEQADKLEQDGAIGRAWYLDANQTSKSWKDVIKGYEDLGYTRDQMFFQEKKKQLTDYLTREYGEEFDISGYNDAINKIAKDFTDNEVNLAAWNKVVDAQLQIPGLSQEDVVKLIQQEGKQPRSVGAFFGNKLLKVAKSHDKETLSEEDRLAKQTTLSGLIGEQFNTAKVALEEYGKLGNPIDDLVDWMKTEEGKKVLIYRDVEKQVVKGINVDKYGQQTQVEYMGNFATGKDGSLIQIGELLPVSRSVIEAKAKDYNATDIQIAQSLITGFLERANDADLDKAYKGYKGNELGLTYNVMTTKDEMMKKFDIPESQAFALATEFVLRQDSDIIDTKMSKYDIDRLQNNVDTENVVSYIESIRETKPEWGVTQEITAMRNDMLKGIELSDMDDQQKQEEIIALNNILKDIIPPAKELNNTIIEQSKDLTEEDKSFLKELNEVPVIGDVSEFLFGEEFGDEILDYAVFIPGFGVASKGIKGLGKVVLPQAAKRILGSQSSQNFITRAAAQIEKGFKSEATKNSFLKGLTPVERAIFNSMSKTGKSVNQDVFITELIKIPGVYIKGFLPSMRKTVGWGLFGSLYAYGLFNRNQQTQPESLEQE